MAQAEWIPSREQRINFKAPRQLKHVFQRARLGLGDIDRLLLLVDTRFHAVIANAVAGGRNHGIVDGDDGERRDRVTGGLECVELGNFFFQRTACERYAERAFLERSLAVGSRFFFQSGRAGVLALVMTPDTVIGLSERAL